MRDRANDRSGGSPWPRRRVLRLLAASGVGTAGLGPVLAATAADGPAVTAAMIDQAEWVTGIDLTPDERALMLEGVNEMLARFAANRAVPIDYAIAPAVRARSDARPNSRWMRVSSEVTIWMRWRGRATVRCVMRP